jgi:hypothetical protein
MTTWWRKGLHMTNYVTQEHFDATIENVRNELHSEIASFRDEMNTRMDAMLTILQRLDQERLFTLERISRIESDVTMIKQHLKLT